MDTAQQKAAGLHKLHRQARGQRVAEARVGPGAGFRPGLHVGFGLGLGLWFGLGLTLGLVGPQAGS
jgi:hypothetical protein